MSEKQSIGAKAAILYGIAIIVVAFIGVVLGNWFVEWRRGSQVTPLPELENWQAQNNSSLRFGDAFPNEELLDLDSNSVTIDSLIAGKKVLVFMISPGCGPCGQAMKKWGAEVDELPEDVLLMAIAIGDVVEMRAYRDKIGIPFPIYCDLFMLYTQQYDLTTFPSIIGLDDEGKVAFVWHGYSQRYSLMDYYEFISSGKTEDVES